MKWVELNIKQIPNVMKEIDRISSIYISKKIIIQENLTKLGTPKLAMKRKKIFLN
jgi:hypothetical protein